MRPILAETRLRLVVAIERGKSAPLQVLLFFAEIACLIMRPPHKGEPMLSRDQIDNIVDSLHTKQMQRGVESGEAEDTFFARPNEKCVIFQINCYNLMLDYMRATGNA
jgi:hypothetical protein